MMRVKRKAGKAGGKSKRRSGNKFPYVHILIILACIFAAWVLWLDHRVQAEFAGKRWSLPARVYASPAEIYVGQAQTAGNIEKLLARSGYRNAPAAAQPGYYSRTASSIEFMQREFHYWDGRRDSRLVRVQFRDGKVRAIRDLTGQAALPLARIEPELIGRIYPDSFEDRILVAYEDVPPALIRALLAVEDRNFFSHYGIDPRGMLRALYHNILNRKVEQGGSTITQQLVKNFFLSAERTLARKTSEIVMALLLERRYGKEEILGAYINEVYLGQQGRRSVHGFGTAAEFYFARPLNELRLDQLALLAGMVKGASWYNPRRHAERARQRRNLALDLMLRQGYLDEPAWNQARRQPLDLSARPRWVAGKHPAFLQLVRQQLLRDYAIGDLRNKGLRIFTTLDSERQESTERVLQQQLRQLERARSLDAGTLQAASIFVQTGTGAVLSLAGGRDAEHAGFNRALQARRPIGSLVKPFVYYTALTDPQRYSLVSAVSDTDISVPLADGSSWRPDNYDGRNHGQVSLLEALAKSYNKATVRLGQEVGLERVIDTLGKAGVTDPVEPFPSLLLGSLELTPLQVGQLYQTLANGGFLVPLNSIREVLDNRGNALRRYGLDMRQALQGEAVFLTAFMMEQAVKRGTGRGLRRIIPERLPLAGKTGTTNDLRDSWFAGFGDDITGVVWLGRDDNLPTGFSGATGALQVWGNMVKGQDFRSIDLPPPPGVGSLEAAGLSFAGACVSLPSIPYVLGFRPRNTVSGSCK